MYYVYILLCADRSYYVGYTENIKNRIQSHNNGKSFSTSYRLPVKIKWIGIFTNKEKAINFEKYLKTGSGIALKFKRLI
jgi:putative endonuclease